MSAPIVAVLYDILRLPLPAWTDDFSKTIRSQHDSSEVNRSKLRTAASPRNINLIDNYLSLILTALMEAELPNVLVQVITTAKVCFFVFVTSDYHTLKTGKKFVSAHNTFAWRNHPAWQPAAAAVCVAQASSHAVSGCDGAGHDHSF